MKKLTIAIKFWILGIVSNIKHRIDLWATNRMLTRYSQFADIKERWDRHCLEQAKILTQEARYKLEMDSWAIRQAQHVSNEDRWKLDMDKWAMERVFMIFETDPKERESVVALFNKYYGNIRTVKSQAAIELSKRMFTEELGRRSWGRVIEIKKGKTRHALAFVTTPDGEFKFNLGRHWENDFPEIGQEGVVLIGEPVN